MPTVARGFRIASSYVQVVGRVDRDQIRRVAARAGRDGGHAFAQGFQTASSTGMRRNARTITDPVRNARQGFRREGQRAGDAYSGAFTTASSARMRRGMVRITDPVRNARQGFRREGQRAGDAYTTAFGDAANRGMRGMQMHGQRGGTAFTQGIAGGMTGAAAAFAPAIAAAGAAAAVIGGSILRAGKDFEAAMNGVRAVTNASADDFAALRAQAKELGATTQFTATEAANAMEFLGMAGWDVHQIYKGLPGVLDMAASGKIGLAEAADIASNVMAGMGMAATEATRAADALATAAVSSNVNIRELGETAKYAAGTASTAGWSVEQLAAATGMFGNVGIKGSMAGTGLNRIIGDLNNSSSQAATLFADLGIEIKDSSGKMRDFDDILVDLMNSEVEASDIIGAFGRQHGPKLVTVMAQGEEALRKVSDAMKDTEGAAKRMAEVRMEGLAGEMKGASSAIEGLLISIADMGILDGATRLVAVFTRAVRGLNVWMEENSAVIRQVMETVGFLVGVFAGTIGTVLLVKGAAMALAATFSFLLSPIGLVALAVTGLAVLFKHGWETSEEFRKIVTGVWRGVQDAAGEAAGYFKANVWPVLREGWQQLKDAATVAVDYFVTEVWPVLRKGWDSFRDKAEVTAAFFKDTVWPILKAGWEEFRDAVQPIVDTVKGFFDDIGGEGEGLKGVWGSVVDTIGTRLEGLWGVVSAAMDAISAIWDAHGTKIMAVVGFVWGWIGTVVSFSLKNLWVVVKGVWTAISGVISGALQSIRGTIQFVTGLLTGDWSMAWEGIKNIFLGTWNSITAILEGAWIVISGLLTNIWNFTTKIFLKIWDWLVGNSLIPELVVAILMWFTRLRDKGTELIGMLKDWIVARFTGLRDRAVAAVAGMRDRVLGALTGMRDRAGGIATTMRDWVVTRARTLRDKVSGAMNTLKDRIVSAFTRAKDGVQTAWGKLRAAAAKPVNFVISSVYNNGIRKFWNAIADKVPGVGPLDSLRPVKFARGGRTSGGTPGKDSIPSLLMADEYVIKRDSARKVGFGTLEHINRTGQLPAGAPVQRFAEGGIVGAVSGFIDRGKDWFRDGFVKALGAVTGPIRATMREMFGRSGFQGLPTRLVEAVIGKVQGFLTRFASDLEGGDGRKVVEVARGEVGVSGRPNKYTRAPGMWTDEWCGMFVDWVFKKAGAGRAISGIRTPSVASYTSLSKVGQGSKRPGDLALYRGDSGHINIVTDPATGETVGGNEGNNRVVKTRGYVNSASSIRRPRFAEGGIVDAADVQRAGGLEELRNIAWQDREETSDNALNAAARARRHLFAPPGTDVVPAHLRDEGGVLLDGTAAVNRKGEAELVATAAQLDRWAAAADRSGTTIHVDQVLIDAKSIREFQDVVRVFEGIQATARQYGSKARVGVRRP